MLMSFAFTSLPFCLLSRHATLLKLNYQRTFNVAIIGGGRRRGGGGKNRAFSCESFIIIGDLGRERVVNFYKVAAKRLNTRTTSQGNNEFLASLL